MLALLAGLAGIKPFFSFLTAGKTMGGSGVLAELLAKPVCITQIFRPSNCSGPVLHSINRWFLFLHVIEHDKHNSSRPPTPFRREISSANLIY